MKSEERPAFHLCQFAEPSLNPLESELSGMKKGAFTGAIALKKGRFELADG